MKIFIALLFTFILSVYGGNTPTCPDATYNLLIILDESGSVLIENYQFTVQFVIDLINNEVNDGSSTAAVAFSSNNDMIWGFGDDQTNRSGITAALQDELNDYNAGGTSTFNVMRYAINEFQSNNISPDDNNLIFLFTDGVPTPQFSQRVCSPSTGPAQNRHRFLVPQLQGLNDLNIRVIVIALNGFDFVPLRCLYSENDLFVGSFTSDDFNAIEEGLVNVLCEEEDTPPDACPCYGDLDESLTYCLSGCCDVGVLAKTKCDNDIIDYGIRYNDKSCFIQTNGEITTEYTDLTDPQYYNCENILIEAAKGNNCTISETYDETIFTAIIALFNSINDPDSDISIFHLIMYIIFIVLILVWLIILVYLIVAKIATYVKPNKSTHYLSIPFQDETTSVTEA